LILQTFQLLLQLRKKKRGEKSWLHLLLVKCKYGIMASKENRCFSFHGVVATRGWCFWDCTPLKCSGHLALKFFKVVWLKDARFSQRCTFVLHIQSVPKGEACANKSGDWSAACTFSLPSDNRDGLRIRGWTYSATLLERYHHLNNQLSFRARITSATAIPSKTVCLILLHHHKHGECKRKAKPATWLGVNDHVDGQDVNDLRHERIQQGVGGELDWVASHPRLWGCFSSFKKLQKS